MKLIKIKPGLFEEAIINPDLGKVFIQIEADNDIDCGIMDDVNYNLFLGADSEEDVSTLKWYEQVSAKKFTFIVPRNSFVWLVMWNAYSKKVVTVAYNIEAA